MEDTSVDLTIEDGLPGEGDSDEKDPSYKEDTYHVEQRGGNKSVGGSSGSSSRQGGQ